jgi:Lrp/AsnC family leucine-responsive transcriptional regulator
MATERTKPLDEIDRRILHALQEDARLTIAEVAERVGLSSTPCWNRIRRLEAEEYIVGYVALLDQTKLGFPDTVIIEVTLDHHDEETLERFGAALAEFPEVLEAYLITGDYDYVIKVAVQGTRGYEEFLRHKLYRVAGIRHSRSMFALRCLKRMTSVRV